QIGKRADAFLVVLVLLDDLLPGRDRGIEVAALLMVDLRDANEISALLVQRRRAARAALERSDEIIPALLRLEDADARVERGHVRRIRVNAAPAQRQGAIGFAELLGELGRFAQNGGARDFVALELRLALEHAEALCRLIRVLIEDGEATGDVELFLLAC